MELKVNYGSLSKRQKLDSYIKKQVEKVVKKFSDSTKGEISVWLKNQTGRGKRSKFSSSVKIKTPKGYEVFAKCKDENLFRSVGRSFSSAEKLMRRSEEVRIKEKKAS